MRHKILLIEDDNGSRLAIVRSLSLKGYAVSLESNLVNAEEDVLARRYDAVVLGINLRDGKGSQFIKGIRVYDPYLPILVITGGDEIEIAVDAVRCGADNVLAKPIDHVSLCACLQALLEDGSRKLPHPAATPRVSAGKENFFGTGPAARRFQAGAVRAAAGDAPVLISGETGTGKGLLARWIHQNGSRSGRPFATLNCSGLRGDLIEAELFGAAAAGGRGKPGLLEKAAGGTLFLDEIGDMEPAVQTRLSAELRARLPHPEQQAAAPALGFHLICASNHRLEALVRAGTFLPELLSLISGTVLKIPPLRDRLPEFPGIIRGLLDGLRGPAAQISEDAVRVLKGYRWPGNLRELKNALERGLMLSHGGCLGPEHFSWLRQSDRAGEARPLLTLSELKGQHIAAVLQRASGDVGEVATSLGISRATMYRRLKQLRDESFRTPA